MQTFEMTNLGSLHYFPGLGVQQLEGRVLISQIWYIEELLKKCGMTKCKSYPTLLLNTYEKL